MRLLLLLKVASALTSGALPPSALYKPTQTGDRALSWLAALGVFAKLVKRRPAAAVVAGLLTQPLAAGITRDLLRAPTLAEPVTLLPDANSKIVDTAPLEGVRIIAYEGRGAVTVHASHGFGSTSESFQDLLEALSVQSNVASVIAHDHPGFGLTKRPLQRRKYMLGGDVALALTRNASSVVYVGHSMGAVSATDAAVRAAESGRRTALVLIAPAIVASRRPPGPPVSKRPSIVARAVGAVTRLVVTRWPFRILVRRLVLAKDFWPRGLGATYGERARQDTDQLNAYAKRYARAAGVVGWERGLLAFCAARLEQVLNALLTGDSIEARLSNALASSSTPLDRVLVVNGINDALVPVANARRLVENLRTSAPAASVELVEVEGAGHCPHEEGDLSQEIDAFIKTI
jgi:pimeloyl-ACP methyl ester carboxylesterase